MFKLFDFTKEEFDIIILAGQSNAAGFSYGPTDKPYKPSNRVYSMNSELVIRTATENVVENEIQSSFVFSFVREYLNAGLLDENRKLLVLKSAVGGTGFLDGHWGLKDDHYLKMMEMTKTALELNEKNRLVALLWHQGESDALEKATYDVHYKNLRSLVESVRNTFCTPSLPFIAGDFVHHWKNDNAEICAPIEKAMRAVCKDLECSAFTESDGLLSNFQELNRNTLGWMDTCHFSRRSCYELGKRYFDNFLKITE